MLLSEAVPNPFNPGTTLRLSVDRRQSLHVTIHDARGHRVRSLLEGVIDPGEHVLTWNGRDDNRSQVASGVYFAKLQSRSGLQVRRLVLTH